MSKNKLICEIRQRLKLSQKDFAQILGITAATVSFYESNSRSPSPRIALILLRIGRELGLSITIEDIYQSLVCQQDEVDST